MTLSDTTIPAAALQRLSEELTLVNRSVSQRYPGDSPTRQPVHTVYGGAHLFTSDIAHKLGAAALRALDEYAPSDAALASAFQIAPTLSARIRPRIVDKLKREPVEDFRIDFEDGFGTRPDEEEDHFAAEAAEQVARGFAADTLPPGIGIRIKTLSEELKARSVRTFDLFLTRLLERTGGRLPKGFVVTLPKITSPAQVAALASACDELEGARGLARGALTIELMVETTQSIFSADGGVALPNLVAAGSGRVTGAHFGTYDYTAGLSITAAHQQMTHPACDFAKHVMQVALAGTPVRLSDGATNIMPVGPHRPHAGGVLSESERRENAEGRPPRVASARGTHQALACGRVLPGMGSPSSAAPQPLRRGLRLLSRRDGGSIRAVAKLRGKSRAGHAGRRSLRRCGNRAGAAELLPARGQLRGDD